MSESFNHCLEYVDYPPMKAALLEILIYDFWFLGKCLISNNISLGRNLHVMIYLSWTCYKLSRQNYILHISMPVEFLLRAFLQTLNLDVGQQLSSDFLPCYE